MQRAISVAADSLTRPSGQVMDDNDTPDTSLGRDLTVERVGSEWTNSSTAWAFADTSRVDGDISNLRKTISQVADHVALMNQANVSSQNQVAGVMSSLRSVVSKIQSTEAVAKGFQTAFGQTAAECRDGIETMRKGLLDNSRTVQQVVEFATQMEGRISQHFEGMEEEVQVSIARVRDTIADVQETVNETKETEKNNRAVLQDLGHS